MNTPNQPCLKIGPYVLGETLGIGTFGKVKIGMHIHTHEKVAVKILNRNKIKILQLVGKVKREIENLKLIRHPHIIRLHQVICTSSDIFMIMKYVSGGELFQYILKKGKLQENETRRFFQQIISAVDYCHRHMIVHRDLKPENLLLDHNLNVKVADFGLSNIMRDGEFLKTSCGSPNYAAPEVISGKLYAGPEVDIWSCGVILYALISGHLPFDDEHIPSLYKKIMSSSFPIPVYFNRHVIDLITSMLHVDPIKRATIEDIKKHEWFRIELPDYLFPQILDFDPFQIDYEMVKEVSEKFGVDDQEVCNALISGKSIDELVIGYHIMIENKRLEHEERKQKSMKEEKLIPPIFRVQQTKTELCSGISNLSVQLEQINKQQDQLALAREQWRLGIRSQNKPTEIMDKVYKAMKALDFEWKVMNQYHVLVRSRKANYSMKMSLQLYRLSSWIHLLDFKMLTEGEVQHVPGKCTSSKVMEFFEMSSSLIKALIN